MKTKVIVTVLLLSLMLITWGCASKPTPPPAPPTTVAPAAPKPTATPTPTPTTKPTTPATPKPTATPAGPPYYQGKVITFVVGYSAGAGTDMFSRLMARHLPNYIPGKPAIVVRNMAGAGTLRADNYVYMAKPDGLTFEGTGIGTPTNNVLRPKGTEFRMEEMMPIIAIPRGAIFYIKPGLVTEAKDIVKVSDKLFDGATSPTGSPHLVLANMLLGINPAKDVWGYSGSAEYRRAFLAGDLNYTVEGSASYVAELKPYEARGELRVLFQTGILGKGGTIMREPGVPDVPTVPELYQQIYGKAPSGMEWDAFRVVGLGLLAFGRTIILPPNVPDHIVKILDQAVADMVQNKQFLSELDRMQPGASSSLMTGQGLRDSFKPGISAPQELVTWVRDFFTRKYGVVFD